MILAFIIGIGIVYWGSLMAGSAVSSQQARNRYLRRQVAQLNQKIQSINKLKKTRNSLTHRMKIIERLQQRRPLEVHLFAQLATTVPSSVYLTSIGYTTNSQNSESEFAGHLKIKGAADSPAGVSNYMRRMGNSRWFTVPQLEFVRTKRKGDTRQSAFSVKAKLYEKGGKQNQDNRHAERKGGGA
jgi:type IV pilus assembly protein PilN